MKRLKSKVKCHKLPDRPKRLGLYCSVAIGSYDQAEIAEKWTTYNILQLDHLTPLIVGKITPYYSIYLIF